MQKKCSHCGKPMPEEASICLHCLTLCDEEKLPDKPKKKWKKPSKKQTAMILTATACLLIILPLGAMQIEQANLSNVSESSNTEKGKEKNTDENPVSSFFKKVFGIEEETTDETVNSEDTENIDSSNQMKSGENNSASSVQSNIGNASASQSNTTNTKPTSSTTNPSQDVEEDPVLDYSDYEYTTNDNKITITKYTGNDTCILIPDQINGKNVERIDSYAFQDNSKLQTVYFKDSTEYHILWVDPLSFFNCKNLKKIVFPKNTDLGIISGFARQCTSLKELEVEHWQYRFVDGGLYYYTTKYWTLYYYCEGYTAEEYHVPDWCSGISDSYCFQYNTYVKRFYLNDTAASLLTAKTYPSIEAFIANDNKYYETIDGVLFSKEEDGTLRLDIYPNAKRDKSFTFPENTKIVLRNTKINNYVETFRLPKTAVFSTDSEAEHLRSFFNNLKTVYIESGHPQENIIKYQSNFLGKVIEY